MRHADEKAKKIFEEIAADDNRLAEDFLSILADYFLQGDNK